MTLNSTGLGVGKSPSYKLDIAGVGNFEQVRVSNTAATNVALVNTTSGLTYTVYSANTASNGFNGFGIFDGSSYVLKIDSSGAATFNGNTTLGDAQTDTATINGQLTARQGEFPSAVRAAASDYAAVTFDGATASTRIASGCQAIGTGDFSMWIRFRVPTSFGSFPGLFWLTSSSTTNVQPNAFGIYIASAGSSLNVFRHGTIASTDNRQATVSNFTTNFAGQVVDVVVTRAGNTLKVYINGTDTAYTETTGGAAPQWGQTVDSGFTLIGAGASSTVFTGRIYRSVVFNRALSASDVTELITLGVNPADQWGTQTDVYTKATFPAAGADSWTALNADITATVNSTAPDATIEWMKVERTTSTGRCDITRNTTLPTGQSNKRFRGSALIYNEDCGTRWFGIQSDNASTVFDSSAQLANGAQGTITQEFVTGNSTAMRVGPLATVNGLTSAGSVALNANYFVKAIVVTRIGAIVDLDFTVGTGYQATDRSTNALHGTLFNGVEFTQPKRVAVLYATTSAATNQQVFGTLAIPANAIIEDIIVNSTGTATVTIRDAVAGNIIVNAASVVAGRQKLTIAQPFSTTGNLWVQSSTTATLQFTILYTIAA
jgi:hypothetical protein